MKVLFVYPDFGRGASGKFYHGVAYLSAALKRSGHEVSLFHVIDRIEPEDFAERIVRQEPDLVAFSATTNMFPTVREYAHALRKRKEILTICGGVHATLVPQQVIESEGIDVVCVGEGEDALEELCNCLETDRDPTAVKNLWFKRNGELVRNPTRPRRENLDELAPPDRTIFDRAKLEDARLNREVFMASRGCPYNCSYCCNHCLREIAEGKYVRFRSAENVVSEIESVVAIRKPDYLMFHDDVLTLNKKWLRHFTELYRQRVNLPFVCNSVASALDERCVRTLREAGCREVLIGVESGDEGLRRKILRREMSDETIMRAFHLCEKLGVESSGYNMIGLPFEDLGKALRTIKLNARARPTNIQVSVFCPFPGTALHELCEQKSFLTSDRAASYFEFTTLDQPSISRREVQFVFGNFIFLVHLYRAALSMGTGGATVEKILDFLYFRRSKLISLLNRKVIMDALVFRNRYGTRALLRRVLQKLKSVSVDLVFKHERREERSVPDGVSV